MPVRSVKKGIELEMSQNLNEPSLQTMGGGEKMAASKMPPGASNLDRAKANNTQNARVPKKMAISIEAFIL